MARVPGLLMMVLLSALFSPPVRSHAGEISVLGGATESINTGERSYAWQAVFRHDFLRNFAASLSWINEGHLEEHKRDGFAAQGWGRVLLLDNRLSIGVGAGIYHYFDTKPLPAGNHENVHGWAPVYSFAATYYTGRPWFAQVAVNHIHPESDLNSNIYLVGVGYRLWEEAASPSGPGEGDHPAKTTGYEVMPFLGQVVVNRPDNDPGIGSGIEFRIGIDKHLDWTATWLNEDVPGTFHRAGLGTQIWLVDAFLARRITLGFGAGLYSFVDREPPSDSGAGSRLDIAGLLTVTTSYRFSDRWFTRFNWNRVMSNDSRDTDLFLLGLGYRWEQ
ncbi:MAG: hypothetical protein Q7J17_03570 [Candidatus Deferrimicrobium sp.]|nr:hypothetical protein [Candidatus Deferrimicrobium sp.]